MSEKQQEIQRCIEKIENNNSKIIFACQDSKGQPVASVENIYRMVHHLRQEGYDAGILHEQDDYTKAGSWLGSEFDEIPHYSIQQNELSVDAGDLLVIPEVFGNIITETTNLPCKRVVLIQSYEYMFDTIGPGYEYKDYNIHDVITINEEQKQFIKDHMGINVHVIPKFIPDYFKPTENPKQPVIAVHSRDKRQTAKIIKQFYAKYKPYKFVSFNDLQNMDRQTMHKELTKSCCSLWVDEFSGFGTFCLESLKSNIPVIGKAPYMVQEWMNDEVGLWSFDTNKIADLIAQYMHKWFEDRLDDNFYNVAEQVKNLYPESEFYDANINVFSDLLNIRKKYLEDVYENLNNEEETSQNE